LVQGRCEELILEGKEGRKEGREEEERKCSGSCPENSKYPMAI
jgi:hypothetical protein